MKAECLNRKTKISFLTIWQLHENRLQTVKYEKSTISVIINKQYIDSIL